MFLLTSVAVPGGTPFSLYASTGQPAGAPVAGPGALCVRTDAGNVGLYINTGGATWVLIGGAGGASYPDDVPATFGTTSPAQGQVIYVSGAARFEVRTIAINAAAGAATRAIAIYSGARTTTDAAAGSASGAVSVQSGPTVQLGAAAGGPSGAWTGGSGTATQSANGVGAGSGAVNLLSGTTDSTVAGGTGGPTGAVKVGSGDATATAGASGNSGSAAFGSGLSASAQSGAVTVSSGNAVTGSGLVTILTGNTTGGPSGGIVLQTGTAIGGVRGVVSLKAPALDLTTQATDFTLIGATAAALRIAQAADVYVTFATTTKQVDFTQRMTTTDGVTGGTARVMGGRLFSTTADSAVITGNGAAQTFADQVCTINQNTLKSGSVVKVRGAVRRTGINGADTAQVLIRLGATVYVQSAAFAAAAGDRCVFEAVFTSRANPGAAVTIVGNGRCGWTTAASPQLPTGNSAVLSTNGNLDLDVQINMPNNIANTAVLEEFTVSIE